MKIIYELNIFYTNGNVSNLLYEKRKDAIKDRKHIYKPGIRTTNGIIAHSFVMDRALF